MSLQVRELAGKVMVLINDPGTLEIARTRTGVCLREEMTLRMGLV
jgi:hypothetical protein